MRQLLVGIFLWSIVACTPEQTTTDNNNKVPSTDSTETVLSVQKPKNHLGQKNLKGKIKTREVLVSVATVKDGYVTNDALKGAIEVSYNEQGNKTKLLTYNEKKEVVNTWEYVYNDDQNILEGKYSDGTVTRLLKYYYNEKKELTHNEEIVNDKLVKKTIYVYNKAGKEVMNEDIFMESNGKSRHVTEYDQKGYKREVKTFDENATLQLKQLYTYNDLGQETQQSIFTGDNIPSYKRKFEYDEKGNKIKNLAFSGDGIVNASDSYKYSYEYDKNGNWTTKIRYDYDDIANEFMEQKIVYYE